MGSCLSSESCPAACTQSSRKDSLIGILLVNKEIMKLKLTRAQRLSREVNREDDVSMDLPSCRGTSPQPVATGDLKGLAADKPWSISTSERLVNYLRIARQKFNRALKKDEARSPKRKPVSVRNFRFPYPGELVRKQNGMSELDVLTQRICILAERKMDKRLLFEWQCEIKGFGCLPTAPSY